LAVNIVGANAKEDFMAYIDEVRSLAEKGDAHSQIELAQYSDDPAESAKWYRKAAEQGDVFAQKSLGYLYSNGKGVTQDYEEAAKWYRKAAAQGSDDAKEELNKLQREGKLKSSSSTSNIPKQPPTCEGQWTPAPPPAPAPTVTGVKPISAFFGNWEYSGGQFKVNITEKEFTHKMEGKYFTFAIDSWTAVNNISPKTKTTYPTGYKITGKTKKQKGFDHYTGITALYVFIKNSWSLVWGKNADDIPSPEYRNDKRFGT
jgi:TPR repeat protein